MTKFPQRWQISSIWGCWVGSTYVSTKGWCQGEVLVLARRGPTEEKIVGKSLPKPCLAPSCQFSLNRVTSKKMVTFSIHWSNNLWSLELSSSGGWCSPWPSTRTWTMAWRHCPRRRTAAPSRTPSPTCLRKNSSEARQLKVRNFYEFPRQSWTWIQPTPVNFRFDCLVQNTELLLEEL